MCCERLWVRKPEQMVTNMSMKDFFKVCKLFSDPLTREPLILIHQIGKVGSQTIEATLRNANLPHKIFRLHSLSPQNVKRLGGWRSLKNLSAPSKESLGHQLEESVKLYHIVQARKFLMRFKNNIPKINFIVGVREPVGWMLA